MLQYICQFYLNLIVYVIDEEYVTYYESKDVQEAHYMK